MIRPALLIGVTVVLCSCGGAEPGADAATPRPLFPLEVGTTWQLVDERTGAAAPPVRVARPAEPSGVVLRGFPGLPPTRVRENGTSIEAWDPDPGRWEPFLRLGAETGTSYRVDLSQSLLWRNVLVTVAARDATASDADGETVRNAVRLTLRPKGKGMADAGLEELVFAPGVGLARVVETTIAGPRVTVLGPLGGAPTR